MSIKSFQRKVQPVLTPAEELVDEKATALRVAAHKATLAAVERRLQDVRTMCNTWGLHQQANPRGSLFRKKPFGITRKLL